ncbi:hypothetical protein AVM11_17705 [Sphingomonas melonis TY]|uniref:Uncharacterized protein n=2 Tax=Sphingomonas TaxID=13687 RepID=A0A175Y3C3_9SPHN|nr:hypothetical protein [Sphingomonas melonis]AOW24705.1 hypothetical protein BJP26_14940 [Sphingomonas melonis TY]KZB95058.1 hypothetical protein AVM11_17705 [Sphingomonas melonis TY]
MHLTATVYRVDWWLPLEDEPGEWTGRWKREPDACAARTTGLAAIAGGAACGLVLVTLHRPHAPIERAAPDMAELRVWDVDRDAMPASARDPGDLPPRGREDIEGSTLSHCREALIVASDADLLHRATVTAILDIVQQAFRGLGPAVEAAAASGADVEALSRARAT